MERGAPSIPGSGGGLHPPVLDRRGRPLLFHVMRPPYRIRPNGSSPPGDPPPRGNAPGSGTWRTGRGRHLLGGDPATRPRASVAKGSPSKAPRMEGEGVSEVGALLSGRWARFRTPAPIRPVWPARPIRSAGWGNGRSAEPYRNPRPAGDSTEAAQAEAGSVCSPDGTLVGTLSDGPQGRWAAWAGPGTATGHGDRGPEFEGVGLGARGPGGAALAGGGVRPGRPGRETRSNTARTITTTAATPMITQSQSPPVIPRKPDEDPEGVTVNWTLAVVEPPTASVTDTVMLNNPPWVGVQLRVARFCDEQPPGRPV